MLRLLGSIRQSLTQVIVPVYLFVWASFLLVHSNNMPIMDDYEAILAYVLKFKNAEGLDQIALLFDRHNEHPLLFSNLAVLLHYYLFGGINFIWIIVIANLTLVLLAILIVRDGIRKGIPHAALIFVPLLLGLHHGTIATWPMAAMQHFSSTLLAYVAIRAFCSSDAVDTGLRTWRFPVLFLSVFSGGANLILLPLLFAYLLIERKWQDAALFSGVATAIAGLFWLTYEPGPGNPSIFEYPWTSLKFMILFLGSPAGNEVLGYPLGIAGLGLAAFVLLKRGFKTSPVYFYCAVFFGIVGAAAAFSRADYGATYALEGKYAIYALCFWVSIVFAVFSLRSSESSSQKWTSAATLLSFAAIASCVFSWVRLADDVTKLAEIHWIIYNDHDRAETILKEAQAEKIYNGDKHISNFPK